VLPPLAAVVSFRLVATAGVPASASGPGQRGDPAEVIPWLGLLLVIILVGAVVLAAARRSFQGSNRSTEVMFTLDDLRAMRERGDLSDEEFETAKDKLIRRMRGE